MRGTTQQHQFCLLGSGQMFGQRQSDAAQSTGNEINAVLSRGEFAHGAEALDGLEGLNPAMRSPVSDYG